MKTPLTENDVRATARKAGLKLQRINDGYRSEKAYRIIDPDIHLVVFGRDKNGFGRSLDQCAGYLKLSPAERWYRLQEMMELAPRS